MRDDDKAQRAAELCMAGLIATLVLGILVMAIASNLDYDILQAQANEQQSYKEARQ